MSDDVLTFPLHRDIVRNLCDAEKSDRIAFLFVNNEVSCLSQSLKGLMVFHVLSFYSASEADSLFVCGQ